jgi:hypothetical protein
VGVGWILGNGLASEIHLDRPFGVVSGMAAAQGPYINMDGDPSFDLKGACSAVEAGRKAAAGAAERERARAPPHIS